MATLTEIHDASQPVGEFAKRVQGAVISTCWAVVVEDAGVTDHDVRADLAKKALQDPRAVTEKYYRVFLSNTDIQAGFADLSQVTDETIQTAVADLWTVVAKLEV